MINITKHGEKRLSERQGLNKSSHDRKIKKVLECGLRHNETTGGLHKYISGRYNQHRKVNKKILVYGHDLYIFGENDELITVFKLPNNLCKIADKNMKRKRL